MLKWILKDFWIKLISVAIAIALWFYVNLEKERNITLTIAPTSAVASSETFNKKIIPDKVKVTLRGKLKTILFLAPDAVELNIPFAEVESDTDIYLEISTKNIVVPSDIEIVKISPTKLKVE